MRFHISSLWGSHYVHEISCHVVHLRLIGSAHGTRHHVTRLWRIGHVHIIGCHVVHGWTGHYYCNTTLAGSLCSRGSSSWGHVPTNAANARVSASLPIPKPRSKPGSAKTA